MSGKPGNVLRPSIGHEDLDTLAIQSLGSSFIHPEDCCDFKCALGQNRTLTKTYPIVLKLRWVALETAQTSVFNLEV